VRGYGFCFVVDYEGRGGGVTVFWLEIFRCKICSSNYY